MYDVVLVGSSFSKSGSGVPEMNSNFYENISSAMRVHKLDILSEADSRFPHLNRVISRNLYLLGIKKKLLGKNIHVMHTIDLFNTIPFRDMSKYSKKKIITVHDFYPLYRKPDETIVSRADDFLKKRCYNYLKTYDHIFATTEEILDELKNAYGIDHNKISVQGPIIGYEYSPIKMPKESNRVIIGYINNFSWNKAPMLKYFIETLESIRSDELEFHIYGNGFPFDDLISGDPRIKYFGYLEDYKLPQTLGSFSVYLSTSTVEGFSIPIAKSKAMKIPVLSYDGDIPAITKNNTCLWNEQNLMDIIEERRWERTDIDRAYLDIKSLRPEVVVQQTKEIYDRVFS